MFGGPARDFVFTVTREELQKMETPMLVLMGFLVGRYRNGCGHWSTSRLRYQV